MAGIYVHIPFCKQKCIYCNFFSVASLKEKEAYLAALCQEMALTKDFLPTKVVDTLYFGGGTPSLLSATELSNIIKNLQRYYVFAPNIEITLEANPEQLARAYLQDLKSVGINRLSIGVQSFDDDILRLLNRRHDAATAQKSVTVAAEIGFTNLSIDLIYDIAYRTKELWDSELQTAFSLPICHFSAYSLTIEENTLLARQVAKGKPFRVTDRDVERDYALLVARAQAHGFEPYEISNFAKDGCVSRHNSSYWNRTPYLGLGAAAHSFNGNVRRWNVANLSQYISGMRCAAPATETETLDARTQCNEYILLGLRTRTGISLTEISALFGENYKKIVESQLKNVKNTHFVVENERIVLTYSGRLLADAIAVELFV